MKNMYVSSKIKIKTIRKQNKTKNGPVRWLEKKFMKQFLKKHNRRKKHIHRINIFSLRSSIRSNLSERS